MNIYFISGLGADERAFQKLKLPAEWNIVHVKYIVNVKNESLPEYCRRLAAQIDSSVPFILVGLSFGGMIAIEMSKFISPEKIILISSISSAKQLSLLFKIANHLNLVQLIPVALFKQVNLLVYWFFGVETKQDKKILSDIILDSNSSFVKWAVIKIVSWKNQTVPSGLFHIHGSADKIFPFQKNSNYVEIKSAGHLMVLTNPDEVSDFLKKIIAEK